MISQSNPALNVVVYTPAFNRASWIQGCMDSVAGQDYVAKRHLVVDDCSTDGTFEKVVSLFEEQVESPPPEGANKLILGTYKGSKIAAARLSKNLGPSGARNWAINTASPYADIYGNLDSDDRYRPGYLSRLMEAFKLPEVGVAYCDYEVINHAPQTVVREFKEPYSLKRLYEDCLLCNNSLVRKSALMAVGGYDEQLRVAEDWDLWLRISKLFLLHHVPECLLELHAGSPGQNCSTETVSPQRWAEDRQRVARKMMGGMART